MIDKPKKVLFKNLYRLKNGAMTTLFSSQNELAKIVAGKSEEYGNLVSLQTFLSQALKASDEKGAKPLPAALKSIILESGDEKLKSFTEGQTIKKEINDSFDYWKPEKDNKDYSSDERLLRDIEDFLSTSKRVVIFQPGIFPFGGDEQTICNKIYSYFAPNILWLDSEISLTYFFPSQRQAELFWFRNKYHMLASAHYDIGDAEAILAELNEKGKIKTYVIGSEHCAIPLYAFITSRIKDKTEKIEGNILTISIESPNQVSYIRYSSFDAQYIFENKILPAITSLNNNPKVDEYQYYKKI